MWGQRIWGGACLGSFRGCLLVLRESKRESWNEGWLQAATERFLRVRACCKKHSCERFCVFLSGVKLGCEGSAHRGPGGCLSHLDHMQGRRATHWAHWEHDQTPP